MGYKIRIIIHEKYLINKISANPQQNYNKNLCWVQEEPENMGGWHFIRPYLSDISRKSFAYIGREASSSPASGFHSIYKKQQAAIIEQAIGPPVAAKDKAAAG